MSETVDQRHGQIRRGLNEFGMRDGEVQESKIFASIGKFLCIWLIYYHAEKLIEHWEVLLVLLAFLITPDLVKKLMVLRFGGNQQSYTQRTEHMERSTVTHGKTPMRIDLPT